MPRRKQGQAVAERAHQILAEKAQRRKRRGGEEAQAQAPDQPKRPRRAKPERKERKPRVHADLLTVAFRGPLAGKFREMAEQYQLSLAKLLQDAVLAYEGQVAGGYQPGTALAAWTAQQAESTGGA